MTDSGHSVLVVDDDPNLCELLAGFLGKHGLNVHTVADSSSMDEALRTHQYDLIVLDLMLPGEDGLSIAKRLKQITTAPIIMLTALTDSIDRVVGLEVGADDYVAKPFSPRILLARIRSVLRRRNSPHKDQVHHIGKLLVVDDDPNIRELLSDYLTRQGFEIVTVPDGLELEVELNRADFDLVILDLKIPGEDGLQLTARLLRDHDLPFIMMTAMGDDVEQVVGLELGADDYVDKPLNPRELLARIKAVLRRNAGATTMRSGDGIYRFGEFVFDATQLSLTRQSGEIISLTSGEFELLNIFVKQPYRTLYRERILELLGEENKSGIDRSIDVRITRLRSKIETNPSQPAFIKTVWGKGYVFCPDSS